MRFFETTHLRIDFNVNDGYRVSDTCSITSSMGVEENCGNRWMGAKWTALLKKKTRRGVEVLR